MRSWWLRFTDGSEACCEGQDEYDAKTIAEKISGKVVRGGDYSNIDAEQLPYPATPIIWQFDHPVYGKCPTFCYSPKQCKGNSSCPKNYSCCE